MGSAFALTRSNVPASGNVAFRSASISDRTPAKAQQVEKFHGESADRLTSWTPRNEHLRQKEPETALDAKACLKSTGCGSEQSIKVSNASKPRKAVTIVKRQGYDFVKVYHRAVKILTQGLARELGARGITVNNVQPGPLVAE